MINSAMDYCLFVQMTGDKARRIGSGPSRRSKEGDNMIKKVAIGLGGALGTIVVGLIGVWVYHFGGPGGKFSACVERQPFWGCVKQEMCANRDFPQLTCR
jgi:hypothetical protein